jgi:hypothetical protein
MASEMQSLSTGNCLLGLGLHSRHGASYWPLRSLTRVG